jgi:DNA-binding YbaB/EbfC family protein
MDDGGPSASVQSNRIRRPGELTAIAARSNTSPHLDPLDAPALAGPREAEATLPSGNHSNLQELADYTRAVRDRLVMLRDEASQAEFTGTAGDRRVTVTLLGTGEMVRVGIDPSVADPRDVATLEELLLAATGDAIRAMRAFRQEKMRIT